MGRFPQLPGLTPVVPSPDDRLIFALARQYFDRPGNPHLRPGTRLTTKDQISLFYDELSSALADPSPKGRMKGRKGLARFGPQLHRTNVIMNRADQAINSSQAMMKAMKVEPRVTSLRSQMEFDHGFKERRAILTGEMSLLRKAQHSNRDIIGRLMKLLKTQPGMGMILMALLGGGSAIGALMGGDNDAR